MTTANLVFGNYVTSATFCLKLGKKEIETLGHLFNGLKVRDGTDASLWSLASKGLIEARSADRNVTLTTAGDWAVGMLKEAGLIGQ
jgi:hypothetical protein